MSKKTILQCDLCHQELTGDGDIGVWFYDGRYFYTEPVEVEDKDESRFLCMDCCTRIATEYGGEDNDGTE